MARKMPSRLKRQMRVKLGVSRQPKRFAGTRSKKIADAPYALPKRKKAKR